MKIALLIRSFIQGFCLILFFALTGFQLAQAQGEGLVADQTEYLALKDLYIATIGNNWYNTANWPTTWPATATSAEFGTWFGVGVENGDVNSLMLYSNNLSGTVPASIGNLQSLQYMNIQSNQLTGSFPSSLSNAHNLTSLVVQGNQFTGSLPTWSGTDFPYLQILYLNNNQFSGSVPASYATFPSMSQLFLNDNQLTGSLPSQFASMTWLQDFRTSGNLFTPGPIPSWIGQMSGLTILLMGGNNFTGTIPASLGNLHNLYYLSLNSNQLIGGIPPELSGTAMTALDLLGNQLDDLSGLSSMTQLGYLGLSNNRFQGPIPEWFGSLSNLQQIHLNGNKFTSLPSSFSNLTNLAYVYLQDNQLTGNFPDVSQMTNLNTLNIANNKFTGTLPPSFASLNLSFFEASYNQLSGPFPSISNWTNLTSLSLTGNRFSGAFPSATGLNSLTIVEASSNQFTSIPVSLLGLPMIAYLNFRDNKIAAIDNLDTEVAANHVHPPATLGWSYIDFNQLDFKPIGTLNSLGFPLVVFPQNAISDVKNVAFNLNGSLSIPSRALQPTTTITWEKKEGGAWSDVTANTEDATHKTFLRSSAVLSDAGTYRWKASDSQFPDGVINSTEIEVNEAVQVILDNYAFQFKYDERNRMTHKKVPGADWVYMVYDKRDRLVMTQDGNQRLNNQWSYTKYDALNRSIITGLYIHGSAVDQAGMNGLISTTSFYETFDETLVSTYGYTDTVFPSSDFTQANFEVLTVTYYDNYGFKGITNISNVLNDYTPDQLSAQISLTGTYPQEPQASNRVLGQVTGNLIKVPDTGTYLLSVNYYDNKYRPIQSISDNALGGKDRSTNIYDFVGNVLASKTTHTDNSALLQWQNVSGVTINANTVTRQEHDGWAWAGASSVEMLPAYTDGWVEVTAISQANSQCFIGLSSSSSGGNLSYIDYALFLNGNSLLLYENGSQIPDINSPFNPGDLLRVVRAGTAVRYYINSNLIYTSNIPSTDALLVDLTLANTGATLQNIRTSFKIKTNTTARIFNYDHAGRLLTTHHSINGATPVLLAENRYNELGQLVDKNLYSTDNGTTFKQSTDYRYNIRGWLTSINNADLTPGAINDDAAGYGKDLFGMELAYEKPVTDLTTTDDVQYNGNISAITYSNNQALGAIKSNGYKYDYDPMNRLTEAEFRQRNTTWGLSSYINAGNVTQTAQAFSETGFEYDLNGNINKLKRSGPAGAQQMDDLTYVYEGNQLLSVSDGGDISKGFVDGNVTGDDYHYDENGNMTADANKNITAITYNYLNLPEKITKGTGDYIKYIYDATGRKLSQKVYDANNTLKKKSDYVGEYFYENDTLKFINHEEGRVVLIKEGQLIAPEYQYHLKDHLGNVRTTFTTKDEADDSQATYETANANVEQSKFLNHDQVRYINHPFYDHTKAKSGPSPEGDFSQRLSGNAQEKIGLARSVSVMPGDKLNIEVFAKYYEPDPNDQSAFGTLMNNIIHSLAVPAGTIIDGAGYALSANNSLPFNDGLTKSGGDPAAPKAYLNWAVFNRDYIQNLGKSGFKRVTANSKEDGTDVDHAWLKPDTEITIDEPGFIYIWLSNESEVGHEVEVYFDDFKVTHTKSPVIQQEEFYSFGLIFNTYQRESSIKDRYLYNGKELQDELNVGWMDYGARMYMPELGRFSTLDPVAGKFSGISPYSYCADNPILLDDPDGRDWSITATKDKKGQWQITLSFTGAVLNSSGRNINTSNYISQQKNEFTKIFAGIKGNANVTVDFKVRSINSKSDINSNEHLIEIKDRSHFRENEAGNSALGGKYIQMNEKFINDGGEASSARPFSHEAGHSGGLWHPFKGKDEDGKYYDGFDDNPSNQRFANGKPSNANSQRDVEDSDKALANDYDYANNFMTYIMYAQKRLAVTPEDYLRANPGKASPGQIYQMLFNYKQGNLNHNDIPK